MARTPDLLDLAGVVEVPAKKRGGVSLEMEKVSSPRFPETAKHLAWPVSLLRRRV